PQMVVLYLIAAFAMKRRPRELFHDPEEEQFRRSVSGQPDRTFHSLRHKFREMEERLAGLERHVTSREYSLDRQFRDLEK
ncbi:MAG TPA: envelope stress response membrane protein PspC, partial [Alphaproteobacteria bacterium]|nr:envelope stress response membrane protein PspC [Alphaproteobacteria bacterium]